MKSPLLNSLFDEQERRPWTVSELNERVKTALERGFSSVWVEAEIVNFVAANSGHWYFTLHDGFSQVKAACYASNNARIRFQPFDGLQVRVRGRLSLYPRKGDFQMLVESLEPVGEGALKVAFEQIKRKLALEGLFDAALKRDLPVLPKRVGVVTSPNGAAFHDILNVLSRRTRTVHITLIPTRVQGETAGEEIETAIMIANEYNKLAVAKIDVLIVGRGGGSSEDLWAFNEERVARAIRGSLIPVISAVGHEIDFTIADLVADRRAPTPSAAAEIVAEAEEGLRAFISQREQDLSRILRYKALSARSRFQKVASSAVFSEFPQRIKDTQYEMGDHTVRMRQSISEKLTTSAQKLKIRMASLDALSPLSVLNRGFSITENEAGAILRDAENVKPDDKVKIRLAKGKIEAKVLSTEKN